MKKSTKIDKALAPQKDKFKTAALVEAVVIWTVLVLAVGVFIGIHLGDRQYEQVKQRAAAITSKS